MPQSLGTARCPTGVSGATVTRVVELVRCFARTVNSVSTMTQSRQSTNFAQVRLSGGGRLCKGRHTEVFNLFLFFFLLSPPSKFLSFSPLFFQACPAQPLWTTNGADLRGTARPGTSTGDTDYLWIVGQCGDSVPPQNVSAVCKTELFAKTECPCAHKVSP